MAASTPTVKTEQMVIESLEQHFPSKPLVGADQILNVLQERMTTCLVAIILLHREVPDEMTFG
jgi:hypothetical protein